MPKTWAQADFLLAKVWEEGGGVGVGRQRREASGGADSVAKDGTWYITKAQPEDRKSRTRRRPASSGRTEGHTRVGKAVGARVQIS